MYTRLNVFPFLMNLHEHLSQFRKIAEVLEQKLINYLQVFHKIRVLENPSKYNLSYSKGITYRRVPLH